MKYDWVVPVAKAAGMAALGALGMVGVQNTVPAVKQATVTSTAPQIQEFKVKVEPQIIYIKPPACPVYEISMDKLKK
jgi:hypothetical protein